MTDDRAISAAIRQLAVALGVDLMTLTVMIDFGAKHQWADADEKEFGRRTAHHWPATTASWNKYMGDDDR